MSSDAKDHYMVLDVSPSATHEEIKVAYYKLSRLVHPDKMKATPDANRTSTPEFHQLSSAWEVLGNPARRREYDQARSSERNRNRGVVQDTVDLDDMDEEEDGYSYACRCSGRYAIKESDLEEGRDIAPCSDCSLKIQVLFRVASDSADSDSE
ncbi:DnaJ sub C member 21 [Coemansia sp. RSA 2671]|uniref:DnaJ sub C member 21 n=1 Tax=Coemansia linderi TaxID=2663919 RepID=A0ACC1KN96_9FUNG|nr:DnaJ sub C member 21 [Coemansia sp. RSA 2675]KAJ2013817.1 DnaJ sub C member 21 [Coemansia sp. S85]KAJ2026079.1 DnaJ sub C member 21 [Coemansia sp. S610]KAJ2347269.1 DnaJ sub C member 21 [Coemansia sp. RSA 2671]KAJ2695358.1 DnaJ sub C member 21 [Coemansia sp. IMI 209128]KAJ2792441.1 DnaJ sub C member 21 [Coemansia linderi]